MVSANLLGLANAIPDKLRKFTQKITPYLVTKRKSIYICIRFQPIGLKFPVR